MEPLVHWLKEYSPADSLDISRDLAYSHARESGILADRICRLIDRCDLKGLVEFEINYSDPELTSDAVRHARQALAFFQKLPDLNIGIDKEAVALRKFLEAEQLCSETNSFFRAMRSGRVQIRPRVAAVIHAAQRKIAEVLGPVPKMSELPFKFGPGATRQVKRKEASIRKKLSEGFQCSKELFPLVPAILGEMPALVALHETSRFTSVEYLSEECDYLYMSEEWATVDVDVIPSKLSFVAKNAKTNRSICVEPGLNVMFQLGIGTYMAKRLAAFGVDIRDQTLNQRRAREGSLAGALATLDLSSASDTISVEIVFELLPLDWAILLSRGRSGTVELPDGSLIEQAKFSSMGNGFTFPLETLIFWALSASCCQKASEASVYGDDIIVPTGSYDLLVEVLTVCGFQVNREKSYSTGPFRESCGKDYFGGIDVRPSYLRGWLDGRALFKLHNFYVENEDQERASRVLKFISPEIMLWGPPGYGDGHLVGPYQRIYKEKLIRDGWSGHFFETYLLCPVKDSCPADADGILAHYSIYRRSAERVKVRRACFRANRFDLEYAPLPLSGGEVKALTLPGYAGMKKVKIYTLG